MSKSPKDKPVSSLVLKEDNLLNLEKEVRTLIALASHADAMAAAQRAIVDKVLDLNGLSQSMQGLLSMLSDVDNTKAADLQHILHWAWRHNANVLLG